MIPSLTQLSVTGTVATSETEKKTGGHDAPLETLPVDLLGEVIRAIDTHDPCKEVVRLCSSNPLWASWLRQDWFYDLINCELHYYGQLETWEAVVEHYKRIGQEGAATPKAYFEEACKFRIPLLRGRMLDGGWKHHPFFGARLLQQAPLAVLSSEILPWTPKDLWNYGDIAKVCVQEDGYKLVAVPTDRADYGEIAKLAVQKDGLVLKYVPTDRADYVEIAKLAVKKYGRALQYVPKDRADYVEIAKLAVQDYGRALQYVPKDRADYDEIARLAVQDYGHALSYVPTDRADYGEIAKLAVQKDCLALQYVPTDRADYGDIAKLAVQNDVLALQHVPTYRADYGELAKLAVQKDGRALSYVPTDRADYGEIAKLAALSLHSRSDEFF